MAEMFRDWWKAHVFEWVMQCVVFVLVLVCAVVYLWWDMRKKK